jgi:hypothetical protein
MAARLWWLLAVLVLGFADVTPADTLKAKFGCPDVAGSQISLSVKIDPATQATTLKWKGKNLGGNASVFCGYDCAYFGPAQFGPCGAADVAGKWKFADDDPTPTPCIGLSPRVQLLPANDPATC